MACTGISRDVVTFEMVPVPIAYERVAAPTTLEVQVRRSRWASLVVRSPLTLTVTVAAGLAGQDRERRESAERDVASLFGDRRGAVRGRRVEGDVGRRGLPRASTARS